jgi:hypothetical protein
MNATVEAGSSGGGRHLGDQGYGTHRPVESNSYMYFLSGT